MKYTITEALVKLKVTNKKIEDSINRTLIGYITTDGSKQLPPGCKSKEDFLSKANSSLESIQDLITFRDNLKKSIVHSNANTQVIVGNKSMSVAEAIEMKSSIKHKKALLQHLSLHYENLKNTTLKQNEQLNISADKSVIAAFAQLPNATESERQEHRRKFIENNSSKLVVSDKLEKVIESLKEEIDNFEVNVDVSLSVVNAKTEIEI